MHRRETLKLVALLKASYPRQPIEPETLDAYAVMLADLELDDAQRAVHSLVATSKWFPTIAEIRREATRGKIGLELSGEEAWGFILRQVAQFGAYRKPSLEEPLRSAVEAVTWEDICLTTNVPSTRSRFIAAYEAARDRARLDVQRGQYAARPLLPGSKESPAALDVASLVEEAGGKKQ